MKFTNALGLVLVAAALLLAAWLTRSFALWGTVANYTVPWLCSAIAIAILIVDAVCVLSQADPGALPTSRAVWTWILVMAVFGVGLIVDYYTFPTETGWKAAAAEWIGFGVILAGAFWATRPIGGPMA